MSQPNGPGIVFNERGPVEFNSLEESRGTANPLALPELPQPQRRAEPSDVDEFGAPVAPEAIDIGQADLEARHTKGETAANQFARGALSALLAPGALTALGAETLGKGINAWFGLPKAAAELAGVDLPPGFEAPRPGQFLEDFGRSLGRASTGRSALEAAQALGALASGEDDVTGIADQARIAVDEQEKAWPLLSTVSQAGGALAFGLGTGGLSTGARGLAGVAALEGGAAGAQVAYEADAPLTEVWTSSILGGTLGAGLSQAPGLVGKGVKKVGSGLAKVFGEGSETLGDLAENRIANSLGFSKRLYKKYGKDEVTRVARDIDALHTADGKPVVPKNVLEAATLDKEDIAARLAQAHQEVGAEIGALRQRASQFIDEAAPDLRPSPTMLASRIEAEVVEPLAKSASQADRQAARYIQKTAKNLAEMGDSASLEDVVVARQAIGKELGDKFQHTGTHVDSMKKVYGIIQDDLAQRFAIAAEGMGEAGSSFRMLNRKYTSIERGLEAMEEAMSKQGNNYFGLSSNIVMAGTLAADVATGMGIQTALKVAGMGLGHKLLQEKGPQIVAALARKFARTHVAVDAADVGGKEAQDALSHLMRARKFIQETGESVGPNPSMGAVGQNTAEELAKSELVRLSGGFDPAGWSEAARAPSPLARVLYRSPILDTVSQDLAATVERTAALKPSLDFDVDAGRLKRLARDADGPQAIGLVQQRVRELADEATRMNPEAVPAFEAALTRLDTADVGGAMAEAHNISRALSRGGQEADARSLALMLGDDAFGQAGKLYRQMTAPPADTLRELSNPARLRDALKTLELRGELSQQIAAENTATLAAYEARKKLTGEALPEGLKAQMRAIENLWSRGEEAVTLDGTRLGRIVDHIDNTVESKVASRVPRVPEGQQVMEAVKEKVEKIRPSLLREAVRRVGRGATVGASRTIERLTPKEAFSRYEGRLETLSQAVVQPDAETQTAALSQAPSGVRVAAAQGMNQKLQTLIQDMPKPKSDIHGTAYDSLSSEDVRLGTAYWDATMDPMSVFDDFARGNLDPDKVAYAWKQYPGLQRVSQAAVLDLFHSQLSPEQRSAVPEPVMTQLDFMLGFNGGLQGTVNIEFSQRMSAAYEAIQQQSATPTPPSRGLVLPTSKPTMTQRIAGTQ